ncbi:RNA-binding S4 domain-containing protein [Ancylobacter defluvii]|uniref:RNA-binding S4 domain-containing protein n=1 Tax=Ancylobacter defluvii TaxID=1282440 RepID=A0A9W6JWU5_9HYPH|nr:S4 domain-containing protein [Ancylobacter defluvii]MBS7590453.1 RNA-binding protein [Ancylobacter defluvii]GLK83374.1 hypothetical protein GCM10017653_14430 [Ancylobacter defluvii]
MAGERHRLDVWLWHARCVRTRSAAAELVRAGHVRLNGTRVGAPAQAVRLGDVLTVALAGRVRLLKVIGFSERRGDAQAARATYLDISTPSQAGDDAERSAG